MKRIFLFITIFALLQLYPVLAQRTKRPIQQKRSGPYATSAFDVNATKMPPNYKAHDIAAVYASLEKKMGPKGEFESTEQYQARMKSATLNASDYTYAFKIEPSDIAKPLFTYDADKQAMEFELSYSYITDAEDDYLAQSKRGIKVKDSTSRSRYIGSNRFGAKATIVKLTGDEYHVSLGKRKDKGLNINFQMPPESAKQAKPYLAALLIGTIIPDANSKVIYTGKTGHEPTMDMPVEANITNKSVSFDLKQVWIYNTQSGEIIKKQAISNP